MVLFKSNDLQIVSSLFGIFLNFLLLITFFEWQKKLLMYAWQGLKMNSKNFTVSLGTWVKYLARKIIS